jgi:UDP-N-acetyl-D-mannosaminuronic acid dehydrogenase
MSKYDICVVGGLGHVGLPLSLVFADKGLRVCAFDISKSSLATVLSGKMPFIEQDAEEVLQRVLANGNLVCTDSEESIGQAETVIIITGTPVDNHLTPDFATLLQVFRSYEKQLQDGQLIILRSTVYPGTTKYLQDFLISCGHNVDVAFCPERIAEGFAMNELLSLPPIISGASESAVQRASKLFSMLNPDIVVLDPIEAEMTKLFTNVYRYIKFAIANQFFTIANDSGVDYYRVHNALKHAYPRAKDLPSPGFAAGPCLYKDTIQVSAFTGHNFFLGQSSLLVNEGLPHYIVNKLVQKHDLHNKRVGILGMSFKANVDDARDSLARTVLCSDVYIQDQAFVSIQEVIDGSDIVVIGAPHNEYKGLNLQGKTVVDIWNMYGNGCKI